MSEAVGLKELLRRKIDKMHADALGLSPPCFGQFRFGTSYGERECNTCTHLDSCGEQTAKNLRAKEAAHLSSSAPFPDLHVPGAKDDKGKPMAGLLLDFSRALQTVVDVGTHGAKKYTRRGWEQVEDAETRYLDAMMRHLLAMVVDPDGLDKDANLPHLAHVAWNALAVLELQARRKETF